MNCPKCNTPNADASAYCVKCGNNLQPSDTPEAGQVAADMFKQAKTLAGMGVSQAKAMADKGIEQAKNIASNVPSQPEDFVPSELSGASKDKLSKLFVSSDEKLVSVIGNSYLDQFLSNNTISKGFVVLSNKRVYVASDNFGGKKKFFSKITERYTIDIENVSCTGYSHASPIGYLIAAAVAVLVALFADIPTYATFAVLIAAALCVWNFFKSRAAVYTIYFPGGFAGLSLKWLKQAEVDQFERDLRTMKDANK